MRIGCPGEGGTGAQRRATMELAPKVSRLNPEPGA